MKTKQFVSLLSAIVLSLCFFSQSVSAYVISVFPVTLYNYSIVLSANFDAPDGYVLTAKNSGMSVSLYSGISTTMTDKNNKKADVLLSSVKINSATITDSAVNFSLSSGVNTVEPSSKLTWTAVAVISADKKVDPATIFDISSIKVPLKIIFNGDENIIDLSGKISATVKAIPASGTISSEITRASFNNGRGLKVSQKSAIVNATSDFLVTLTLTNSAPQSSIFSLYSDLTDEYIYALAVKGTKSVSLNVKKEFFYSTDYDEFFSNISIFCDDNLIELNKITISFTENENTSSPYISFSSLTLNKGSNFLLTSEKANYWYSSDTSLATVKNGRIAALSVGETKITAIDATDKGYNCQLTVILSTVPADSLKLQYSECIIRIGKKYTLNVTASPVKNTDVLSWTSSNPAVVSINPSTGKMTGIAPGTAIITVAASSGKTASCFVTVKMPE